MTNGEASKSDNQTSQADASKDNAGSGKKPALSLSGLSSKFTGPRRDTPTIPDLTYAEQLEDKILSADLEAVANKPAKTPARKSIEPKSTKPFSDFVDEELGKRITIRLPVTVDRALRIHAGSNATLITNVVTAAIEDYMKKNGIKP